MFLYTFQSINLWTLLDAVYWILDRLLVSPDTAVLVFLWYLW